MPILNWVGKEKVVNHHKDVPYKILDYKYSYKKDGEYHSENESNNMIIKGDNLEVLKSLLPKYEGSCIVSYLDPPYNTGNTDKWLYNDNVDHPKIREWLGKLVGGDDDLSRHDKWLCMMYPRLQLIKKLLADDGLIFISIDDNEMYYLKLICDEIFGANNFVANLAVEMSKTQGMKVSAAQNGQIVKNHEYVLIYCKNLSLNKNRLPLYDRNDLYDDHFNTIIDENLNKTSLIQYIKQNKELSDEFKKYGLNIVIKNISKLMSISPEFNHFMLHEVASNLYQDMDCNIKIPDEIDELLNTQDIVEYEDYLLKKTSSGKLRQYGSFADTIHMTDEYEPIEERATIRGALWKGFYSDMMNVKKEGDTAFKNSKKPVRLIKQLLKWANRNEGVVIDPFGGSGTTAQAVMELNNEDNGNRNFIIIEMEDYAEEITANRIKKVIDSNNENKLNENFNFYEVGQPLLINNEVINENIGLEKIREYIFFIETRTQISQNATLSDNEYFIGEYNYAAYYFYYEKDKISTLNHEFLSTIKTKAEAYVVYADINVLSEEELNKYNIVFKKTPRDIVRI